MSRYYHCDTAVTFRSLQVPIPLIQETAGSVRFGSVPAQAGSGSASSVPDAVPVPLVVLPVLVPPVLVPASSGYVKPGAAMMQKLGRSCTGSRPAIRLFHFFVDFPYDF